MDRRLPALSLRPILPKWMPRLVGFSVLVFSAALLVQRYFVAPIRVLPTDFAVTLRAWERVQAGRDPYVLSDFSPYQFVPGTLGFISVLPSDPMKAWFFYIAVSLVAFLISVILGTRLYRFSNWTQVIQLVVGLALAWRGIVESLDHGQSELIALAVIVVAARLFKGWPLASGFLLGLLPILRLSWLLLFFPFVLRALASTDVPYSKNRFFRRLSSGYFIACFYWAAAVPSLMFGPERAKALSQSWLRVISAQSSDVYLAHANQSLYAFATRYLAPHGSKFMAMAWTFILIGLILGYLIKRTRTADLKAPVLSWISPWLLFTQLCNPFAMKWASVFAIGSAFGARSRWLWIVVAVLWLMQQGVWDVPFAASGVVTAYWLALVFL